MNIGIIGSGPIVERIMETCSAVEGICFGALYSRNPDSDRVHHLTQSYNIPKVYGTLEDLLADDDLNFIYIASPNNLHYSQSLMALEAGKNVICEKPFTTTAKEAQHLLQRAKEKKIMIFEAICNIYLPNFLLIKKNLDKLGTIRLASLNYTQYSARYDLLLSGSEPNIFSPNFAGGVLQDLNIYNLHFIMNLFGVPKTTQYFANKYTNGIDTSGVLIAQYDNFVASLTASKDCIGENSVLIQGDQGYIHIPGGASGCRIAYLHLKNESEPLIFDENANKYIHYYEFEAFKKMFDDKNFQDCYAQCAYSVDVMKTLENARHSAGILYPEDKKELSF